MTHDEPHFARKWGTHTCRCICRDCLRTDFIGTSCICPDCNCRTGRTTEDPT